VKLRRRDVSEEEVIIRPTILYRARPGAMEAVTVNRRDGHTMIVFRSEEEAEDFKPLCLDHEQLAAFLEVHECTHVGMPDAWTQEGGVDRFEASDFIGMLEESVPA
jgi:hypothetical protein